MINPREVHERLRALESEADSTVRIGDAARLVDLWLNVASLCIDNQIDFNDRLLRWAINISDRVSDANPQVFREVASIALGRELLPLVPLAFIAMGILARSLSNGGVPEFCFAAALYRALGEECKDQLDLTAAALSTVELGQHGEGFEAARSEYDLIGRILTNLPLEIEKFLTTLLADLIGLMGERGAVDVADRLTKLLVALATKYNLSVPIKLNLARGLRNAITMHGRRGDLSKGEEYFGALVRTTEEFTDEEKFQEQIGAAIVSMNLYYTLVGKKEAAREFVNMLEALSLRFPKSSKFADFLTQAKVNLEYAPEKTVAKDRKRFNIFERMAMAKALGPLDEPLKFADCIIGVLDYTPEVREMERDPGYRNWSAGLARFRNFPKIAPLLDVLDDIATGGLPAKSPALLRYRVDRLPDVPWQVFWNATQIAKAHMSEAPHSSFVLAAVAVLGWLEAVGDERLFYQYSAVHPGWLEIPYIFATVSMMLGNITDTGGLANYAYARVSAAKTVEGLTKGDEGVSEKERALEEYRELSGRIYVKYMIAAANLADELYECCRSPATNLKAEVGAVLFTLGYVPESRLFVKGSEFLPSRLLLRRVVVQSLASMSFDGLLRSVWLEIVESSLIQWRDHRSLQLFVRRRSEITLSSPFALADKKASVVLLDALTDLHSPATTYAYALITWFRTPSSELLCQVGEAVMEVIERIKAVSEEPNPFVITRLFAVAALCRESISVCDSSVLSRVEWEDLVRRTAIGIRSSLVYPECPEVIMNQLNGPVFGYIEQKFSTNKGQQISMSVLDELENVRRSELQAWTEMNPPLRLRAVTADSRKLLDKEDECIRNLRGAYFALHYPLLPLEYRLFGMRSGTGSELTHARGREELNEIREELAKLFAEMKESMPLYVHERTQDRSAYKDLVDGLSSHRMVR